MGLSLAVFGHSCSKFFSCSARQQDPVAYVVPDLKNFIKDSVWKQAERRSEELHVTHPNLKKMHVKDRETAGLQFAEQVVNLFINGMNDTVLCLDGKEVALAELELNSLNM